MDKKIDFRLPDQLFEQLQQAIKEGKAKNPSELIRASLEEFLNKK